MTTTVTVTTGGKPAQVIGHDNTGLNVQEEIVEPHTTKNFFVHDNLSFTVSEKIASTSTDGPKV